ncbi:MAG: helix-turn-helix domain-containing protein [Verrucomicrobia bacterium]|nr:helix-turn-helix domain-containing protein [Verrucomicrobiota bacterium]
MKLHSKKEVCGMLGISPRSLDRRISAGEIQIVKVGRLTKITLEEVKAFVKRNSHGGLAA